MTDRGDPSGGDERRSSRLASPESRRYLASAPVPLAIYDAERIIFLNEAGVELLGVGTAEDLVGEQVLDLVHPDDRDRATRRIREVLEERRPSPEEQYRIVRPDGELRYAAIRSIPIVHDGRPAVQSMVHDITQEVEARRRLEESEARFRAVAESARDGLVTVDTDSRIVYANPAAHDIFGYPEGELVGHTLTELMPEDTDDPYLEAVREYLASAEETLGRSGVELPAVRRDDTRFTIGVSFASYEIEGTPYYTGIIRDVSERKGTERQLRRRRERLARILDSLQEGITILDRDGRISYANHAATRILGLEASQIVSRSYDSPEWSITDLDGEPVDPEDLPAARSLRTGDAVWDETLVVDRPDRAPVVLSVSATPYAPEDEDEVVESIVSFSDITDRMRERRALRHSEERYRLVFEDSKDVIYITGRDGTILAMNPAGEELFGFPRDELIGMNAIDLYQRPGERRQFQRAIEQRGYVDDFEFRARTRSGAVRNCLLTSTVRTDDEGEVVGYQGIIRDITERKKFEQELEHRALHDDLTELPNRTLFFDRLEQAIARTERTGDPMAVLFLDLDGFKAVNDSLGHTAGDQVLAEVARRLASAVRDPDTVARVGGDEFTVLLEGLEAPDHGEEVSERIAEALEAPFTAAGENVHLKASIGVARLEMRDGALFPDLESPEDLVRQADAAMFRAKDLSSTRFLLYDPELDVAETARIQRENDLRRALDEEEFVLHYQPVVSLRTGEIRGVEPLVRWNHPDRGLLEPSEFLSLAEETGLIVPLGRWILRRAADRVADWSHGFGRQLEVYPNLSAAQFEDPGLTDLVTDVLTEFDLAPGSLHLEVTEHLVMRAPERTRKLAGLGVDIVIDDFGTGYSSLSYVRDLEVHSLKVDRTFVAGLGRSPQDEAIVTTILTLGDALELEVVAEGVETEAQLAWLREAGCPAAQGFFLARPRPADEAGELLAYWEGLPGS